MMQHKNQGSSLCGFRQEDLFMFSNISKKDIMDQESIQSSTRIPNGKDTKLQETSQTRANRSALSLHVTTRQQFVCFVALRPKSTAMVIAGRSVHLTTLFFLGKA